jgi:hypothetical protein
MEDAMKRHTLGLILLALALACPAWVLCAIGRGPLDPAREAIPPDVAAMLRQAEDAHEKGLVEEALAAWSRVILRAPGTSAWGVAVINSGICLRGQGRHQEAVALLSQILGSGLNDRDPGGNLMRVYQNYRHTACLELSSCFEAMGDRVQAVRYAVLARDRHQFQSWCGTCQAQAWSELRARLARLGQPPIRPR